MPAAASGIRGSDMSIIQSIISGVVQGLTEFFPISSSGHLVMLHAIFGVKEPQLAFDVFLHLGTVLSVIVFFRKDIMHLLTADRKTLALLVIASIPTFVIAILFKDFIESAFALPSLVALMLIVTGFLLLAASYVEKRLTIKREPSILKSIIIGIAQGVAIIPGISRSGSTIATGMFIGMEKSAAVRFSFLLSIPAILGASVFKARSIIHEIIGRDSLHFVIGGAAAAIAGFFAIAVLLKMVQNNKFYLFGIYCIVVGVVSVLYFR